METVIVDPPLLTLFLSKSSMLDRPTLEREFVAMQELLFNELGIICPKVRIQNTEELSDGSFQLQINDAALSPTPGLEPDQFWLNYPASQLPARGLTGRPALEPNLGTEAAIMQGGEDIAKTWRDAGYTTRSPLGYVIFKVAAVIRRNPSVLLSADLVEHYLTTLQATYPILVKAALKRFNVEALTQILRDKLDARASIRNLPGILESLLVTDALR